ncbi:MAG: AraC family transcriptional regulator [Desulfobacteraceae bacterium]|nr:MAG: AraC family transcriptional regulator [Desulfobacteraceae bacterium]
MSFASEAAEKACFWHAEDIGHLELLKAVYVRHVFSRHAHEGYAIGVIEAGTEAFYYRGKLHVAPTGSIVAINPDTVHTGHAAEKSGWAYRMLYPSKDLVLDVSAQGKGGAAELPYFPDPVIRDDDLARRIQKLHRTLETSVSTLERETQFLLVIGQLISRHVRNRFQPKETGRDHRAVIRIKDYIHACSTENISLHQLADLAGLSPYYLTRLFTRIEGLPPHAYLTQVRIGRAKAFIRQGMSLSEVAVAAGFTDQSHFTRHFKRLVGVTPGKFSGT